MAFYSMYHSGQCVMSTNLDTYSVTEENLSPLTMIYNNVHRKNYHLPKHNFKWCKRGRAQQLIARPHLKTPFKFEYEVSHSD